MRWSDGFITADWCTTNRRAYLIDSSGNCVAEFEDDKGILSVPKGGFEAAIAEVRERPHTGAAYRLMDSGVLTAARHASLT